LDMRYHTKLEELITRVKGVATTLKEHFPENKFWILDENEKPDY